MLFSRSVFALGVTLSLLGACSDSGAPTAVSETASPSARHLVLVSEVGSSSRPIDAWMGDTITNALRVRVVDEAGRPVIGVRVRFSGASIGARDAITENDGVANAGNWTPLVRDTISVVSTVTARLTDAGGDSVQLAARTWRDLGRFGGDEAAVLNSLPLDRTTIRAILPLGTFSTDDALPSADALVLPTTGRHVVRAPSDALVIGVDAAERTVTLRVRNHVRVRLSDVAPNAAIWVGRVVHGGEPIGVHTNTDSTQGVGIRVMDASVSRARWVRPERYGARSTTAFFARYLVDSLRSNAFALVRRAAPDLDGRVDFDIAGRVIGTWFDDDANDITSTVAASNTSPFQAIRAAEVDPSDNIAPVALTFSYDAERPGQVRIAVGSGLANALGLSGVHAVAWEDPDPATIDATAGIVRYHLYSTSDEARVGRPARSLLVQVVNAETLRVEAVPSTAGKPSFSAHAITLIR